MRDTLDRARRFLRGDDTRLTPGAVDRGRDAEPGAHLADVSFALGRVELERLLAALENLPGAEAGRPNTPALLASALGQAIVHVGGRGTPSVTRQPAGLYTPEAWQIGVQGADGTTRAALERAIRSGGLES